MNELTINFKINLILNSISNITFNKGLTLIYFKSITNNKTKHSTLKMLILM